MLTREGHQGKHVVNNCIFVYCVGLIQHIPMLHVPGRPSLTSLTCSSRIGSNNGGRTILPVFSSPGTRTPGQPAAPQPRRMATFPAGFPGRNVMSVMFAAAMPNQQQVGRPNSEARQCMLGLFEKGEPQTTPTEAKEPECTTTKWNPKAWDAFEYRTRVPTLAQYDRDKSTRKQRDQPKTQEGLITVAAKHIRAENQRNNENNKGRTAEAEAESRGRDAGAVMGAMMAAASPRR